MSNDKMREYFENWHGKQVSRLVEFNEPTAAKVWKDFKEMHWSIWKASREELVIELPELHVIEDRRSWSRSYALSHNNAIESCVKAIEAAGVKVKP